MFTADANIWVAIITGVVTIVGPILLAIVNYIVEQRKARDADRVLAEDVVTAKDEELAQLQRVVLANTARITAQDGEFTALRELLDTNSALVDELRQQICLPPEEVEDE